ncbi:MAG: hypothetical protein HYV28_13610 [Ignavibacteriales bacterium]|nr:hypothetical protein [Ignavibacteriales bacterium]
MIKKFFSKFLFLNAGLGAVFLLLQPVVLKKLLNRGIQLIRIKIRDYF